MQQRRRPPLFLPIFCLTIRHPPGPTLFPYTTLFRSRALERDRAGASIVERSHDVHRTGAREAADRSEEHTSELQSHHDLVCRLLLEKKKKKETHTTLKKTHKHVRT